MQHESLQRSVTTAAVVIKPVPAGWRPWEHQTAPGLSLGLNSPRPAALTNVHADRVCAVRGRWWTSVNAGAHCWKAYWGRPFRSSNLLSSATLTCEAPTVGANWLAPRVALVSVIGLSFQRRVGTAGGI